MNTNFCSEKELQNEILHYLHSSDIFAWRQNTGAFRADKRFIRMGFPGISDIIGILPDGRFLAIEVKSPKGKLTEYQKVFLSEIKANGGVAIIARSLHDVISTLKTELTKKSA